jgi:hypothetical protein
VSLLITIVLVSSVYIGWSVSKQSRIRIRLVSIDESYTTMYLKQDPLRELELGPLLAQKLGSDLDPSRSNVAIITVQIYVALIHIL